MSEIIRAPFTKEQVINFNKYQHSGKFHEFTCLGKVYVPYKGKAGLARDRKLCPKDGVMIAIEETLTCPCGDYTQDWCHKFMVDES